MTDRRAVDDDGWDRAIDVGGGVRLLVTDAPNWPECEVMVEHTCKDIGQGERLVIAPGLSPGHRITQLDPVTITPSLLCPDCGLHGFITDGTWRGC